MNTNQIIQGDCLEVIKTFPDESIHAVVTSPPYWGLRDYGTADWEGGDDECEHVESENKHGGQRADRNQEGYRKQYIGICASCGAKRIDSQLGLEKTPEEYVENLVTLFKEIKRVLRKDGTVWLNLGDSYASDTKGSGGAYKDKGFAHFNNSKRFDPIKVQHGLKPKDLVGIPWRVAFALQADGWYLRQDIIWHKPNPMPESVTDRCTKSHEYIFLLTKSQKYYFDNEAIAEDTLPQSLERVKYGWKSDHPSAGKNGVDMKKMGDRFAKEKRNKRSVWTVTTKPFSEAHFAVYPEDLIIPCIKTTPKDAIILDPFMGAATTAVVALKLDRKFIGIELNPEYIKIAEKRINPLRNKLF